MTGIASKSQLRMSFLRYALVTVPLILLLGITSGRAANSGYENAWFAALVKPEAMPGAWVFGFVWTLLYIMMGFALAMILHARGARGRPLAIGLFIAQFVLNLTWSPIFFAAHQVTTALIVIIIMLALAIATTFAFARIRKAAAWLMVPYLAWLCFAAVLNYEIDRMNPNAETLVPGQASTDILL